MAERMLRRGLPRTRGGEPWPSGGVAVAVENDVVTEEVPEPAESVPAPAAAPVPSAAAPVAAAPAAGVALRRGLPRTKGGEAWPAATASAPAVSARSSAAEAAPAASAAPSAGAATDIPSPSVAAPAAASGAQISLRRGLPRTKGGEGWPPEGAAAVVEQVAAEHVPATAAPGDRIVPASPKADVSTPLPFTRTVWKGVAPRHAAAAAPEPSRFRPTWTQAIAGLFGAAGLGLLAVAGVFLVRAFLSLPFMRDFLQAYPGEYHTPAEPGIAPWIGWQHFFNMFLMILIIRSGLRVRTEKRPTVFWTPRGNSKGKISLTLWFHQALDILWLVNGAVFVVLLFATGHWARIVPTSWEVFPNALSSLLQYVSLDWPSENGWNNYNSLQQLAYFTTVFLAAPLAAVTGFRMSGLWPKKAEKLSKAYPVEWARALHFPVMLYFVAFIIVHVALVVLTGFLRNLNHMYASQDAAGWTGFWVFVASVVVIIAGWIAARPLVLAPIAKLFGQVSGR
ncbi:cytochrome b/b6 domain-containing protein [Microbacterium sp.]|uniref:cytochrome b/b6 domain-containing protein n=1 Tax=Microbacterium sp. TaxID=51671 RepID=UPI00333E2A2C